MKGMHARAIVSNQKVDARGNRKSSDHSHECQSQA
jgi:hypothetical protein